MPEAFDPYYQWLGIPPSAQPADHYRLLGLQLFEENADVIDSGAERQTVFLRNCQIGKYSEFSQKLLNEIAAAKICLLNPAKKAAYDAKLRRKLSTPAAAAAGPKPSPVNLAPASSTSAPTHPRVPPLPKPVRAAPVSQQDVFLTPLSSWDESRQGLGERLSDEIPTAMPTLDDSVPTVPAPVLTPSAPVSPPRSSLSVAMWLTLGISAGALLVGGLSVWLVSRRAPPSQLGSIDRQGGDAVVSGSALKPAVAARRPPKSADNLTGQTSRRVEGQAVVPAHVARATEPKSPATAKPTSPPTSDTTPPQNPQPADAPAPAPVPIPRDIAEPRRIKFDRIELPGGSELSEAMVDAPEQWRALIPPTAPVYVDSYRSRDGKNKVIVRGGYTLKKGDLKTLHGPAVRLFEDGSLATLAEYQSSLLHGKLRVWDEQGHRVYYGEYLHGKKNGLVCVFCDGSPWLMQQCEAGNINAQYLIVFKSGAATAVPADKLGPEEAADFRKGVEVLADLETKMKAGEQSLKKALESWYRWNLAQAATAKRRAASSRIAAHKAADDASMGALLQSAMRRGGQ